MSGVREKNQQDVVLRPGVVIPVMGYLASAGFAVTAVIVIALPGPHNHSLDARWLGGQVAMVFAWAFYKFGSQRIVLSLDSPTKSPSLSALK